jgi:iduronate 2-sulfatase
MPVFAKGVSLKAISALTDTLGHAALAYTGNAKTIRTKTHRLILHKDGFVELYDLTSPEKETRNIADEHPDVVVALTKKLKAKHADSNVTL